MSARDRFGEYEKRIAYRGLSVTSFEDGILTLYHSWADDPLPRNDAIHFDLDVFALSVSRDYPDVFPGLKNVVVNTARSAKSDGQETIAVDDEDFNRFAERLAERGLEVQSFDPPLLTVRYVRDDFELPNAVTQKELVGFIVDLAFLEFRSVYEKMKEIRILRDYA